MLEIEVPMSSEEYYDEESQKFVNPDIYKLRLEHSLVSLSKWEEFFEKPFLGPGDKSSEETLWYIKAMTIDPDVPPEVFENLTPENVVAVNEHINAKKTATTFREGPKKPGPQKIITNELIYSWMVSLQIPFECQHWHLNRLITLIRVLEVQNSPQKKMSPQEIAQRNRELNAQRRAQLGSSG